MQDEQLHAHSTHGQGRGFLSVRKSARKKKPQPRTDGHNSLIDSTEQEPAERHPETLRKFRHVPSGGRRHALVRTKARRREDGFGSSRRPQPALGRTGKPPRQNRATGRRRRQWHVIIFNRQHPAGKNILQQTAQQDRGQARTGQPGKFFIPRRN